MTTVVVPDQAEYRKERAAIRNLIRAYRQTYRIGYLMAAHARLCQQDAVAGRRLWDTHLSLRALLSDPRDEEWT